MNSIGNINNSVIERIEQNITNFALTDDLKQMLLAYLATANKSLEEKAAEQAQLIQSLEKERAEFIKKQKDAYFNFICALLLIIHLFAVLFFYVIPNHELVLAWLVEAKRTNKFFAPLSTLLPYDKDTQDMICYIGFFYLLFLGVMSWIVAEWLAQSAAQKRFKDLLLWLGYLNANTGK